MSDLEKRIKECKKQAYIDYQKASGLKVGDKVKVTRKAESFESGWTCIWIEQMNDDVGQIFTITNIDKSAAGIMLGSGSGWYFPFFVLKKIPAAKWECLSHAGEWLKSLNLLEDIERYKKLGFDSKYNYRHNFDMLYRIKRK